jgi:4-hydroxybenzoate polyprenyltransferase
MVGPSPGPATPSAAPLARLRDAVRALRLHQWSKNVLVFLPLLAAHKALEPELLFRTLLAFLAFGLVASGHYVLNDLLDLEADRRHARKRNRPFASGALPASAGVALVPALLAAGVAVALLLPRGFQAVLAGYLAATSAYSLALKRVVILDVLLLAGLYTSRMFAGAFAADVPVSEWLASFSMFLFLSLALLKRASEIVETAQALHGRGYLASDREPIFGMGVASGYLAVLVLALYVSSNEVRLLYSHPGWLWALCPLVLYWVSRLWIRAHRGEVRDDPVLFALRDPASWLVAALGATILLLGT